MSQLGDLGRHVNQIAKYGRYYYLTIHSPRPNDKQQTRKLLEITGVGHGTFKYLRCQR
jgi:hypothetical protein